MLKPFLFSFGIGNMCDSFPLSRSYIQFSNFNYFSLIEILSFQSASNSVVFCELHDLFLIPFVCTSLQEVHAITCAVVPI